MCAYYTIRTKKPTQSVDIARKSPKVNSHYHRTGDKNTQYFPKEKEKRKKDTSYKGTSPQKDTS